LQQKFIDSFSQEFKFDVKFEMLNRDYLQRLTQQKRRISSLIFRPEFFSIKKERKETYLSIESEDFSEERLTHANLDKLLPE